MTEKELEKRFLKIENRLLKLVDDQRALKKRQTFFDSKIKQFGERQKKISYMLGCFYHNQLVLNELIHEIKNILSFKDMFESFDRKAKKLKNPYN